MYEAIFEHMLYCTFADKFNENVPWKCKPATLLFNKRCVSEAPGIRSFLDLHLKCRSSGTMWVVQLVAGFSPWVSGFQAQAHCAEFVVGMREYYCVFTVWCLYVTCFSSADRCLARPFILWLAGIMLQATKWWVALGEIWNVKTFLNHFPGKAKMPKQFWKFVRC